MSYNTRTKLKSDTESNWLSQDPVLLDGEVAIVKCDGGITRKKLAMGLRSFPNSHTMNRNYLVLPLRRSVRYRK